MNKSKLPKSLWQRVRLLPVAKRRTTDGQWLPQIDDTWIPSAIEQDGVRIRNIRTDHAPLIPFKDLHSYDSDPLSSVDGLVHGIFKLKAQLTLSGCNVFHTPIRVRRRRHRSRD